jgi:hypothetical protein
MTSSSHMSFGKQKTTVESIYSLTVQLLTVGDSIRWTWLYVSQRLVLGQKSNCKSYRTQKDASFVTGHLKLKTSVENFRYGLEFLNGQFLSKTD